MRNCSSDGGHIFVRSTFLVVWPSFCDWHLWRLLPWHLPEWRDVQSNDVQLRVRTRSRNEHFDDSGRDGGSRLLCLPYSPEKQAVAGISKNRSAIIQAAVILLWLAAYNYSVEDVRFTNNIRVTEARPIPSFLAIFRLLTFSS